MLGIINLKKVVVVGVVLAIVGGIGQVYAQYLILDGNDLRLDKNLSGEITEYSAPRSIVIVPITPPSRDFNVSFNDWYKGIYYYQVTRYNLPAISFHYVITNDGKLIANDLSIPDRRINNIESVGIEGPIVVGYMTDIGSIGFKPSAKGKIGSIILDLANQNTIPLENVYVRSIDFTETDQRELRIDLESIFVSWQNDLNKIIDTIRPNYSPISKTYSVDLVEVVAPTEEFEVSSQAEVKIKLKNTSQFLIYGPEILLTKIGDPEDASIFYVNDIWASQTQVRVSGESDVFRVNEEKEFGIKLNIPFEFGTIGEQFKLTDNSGQELSSEIVNITVNVKRPDGEIIEITETGAGYLRVRDAAAFNGTEITRVSPGDRFIVLDRESGWVQIQFDENSTGWVSGEYTQLIN